jgi:hypothetical protein
MVGMWPHGLQSIAFFGKITFYMCSKEKGLQDLVMPD